MADYKAMYYHQAGRMAGAIETLDAAVEILEASVAAQQTTATALRTVTEKLKLAQQAAEDMFIHSEDDLDNSEES